MALSVDFELQDDAEGKCTYTAPVIPDSKLPPLLGLKSLMSKRAIIDTQGRLLILPGEGGVEFQCSPGTQVLNLDLSESGHLLLPMAPTSSECVPGTGVLSSTINPRRVDFNVQCRTARTPSPCRGPFRSVPSGPYERDGDVIRTGRQTTTHTTSARGVPVPQSAPATAASVPEPSKAPSFAKASGHVDPKAKGIPRAFAKSGSANRETS